ncbi:hypothetical protein CWI75_15190 [Kineobactrum sediminis]|uniref:Carboxymuconolactone decarboxylase-like domain-containing protein n=1 Tax=Kineobactrum sediminis TaxID=1905677 RepID=A0A2N5XZK2_9GAMM|nr:hypothetical protein [Kineobactrum sediminis]PLW81572.1 hypothetical protein CWI75_15190 [Kineobactrum sediminis]
MSWIIDGADRETHTAALPVIGDHFEQLYASFWELPQLPAQTLELCRLRLAQLHRSHADFELQKYPLASAKRDSLKDWHRGELFTAAERACLEFTEIYAMDCRNITDEQATAVKQHHGEVGLVALLQALGVFDGVIRLGLIWQTSATGVTDNGH